MQSGVSTLLSPIGYQASDCGYCKGNDTSAAYYASTKSLGVEAYQTLIDRGWRRSGSLLYKPDVLRACCPHYTIRLPAALLKTSRDQRQALNRWNKFVLGEDHIKEATKKFPRTKEEKARQNAGFDLLHTVHEAEASQLKPLPAAHHFSVTLEPDIFTEEKYLLYANYQEHVHHDAPSSISRSSFKRFLCDSPVERTTRPATTTSDASPQGSFHHCYRLDGRLIAMAVLDLLPHAVSGVYFLYHADYARWSFGKISALREAALTLELGLQYYYMGFYIHGCAKMRYKGDYVPQHVVDPISYQWWPLAGEFRERLEKEKFVTLAFDRQEGSLVGTDEEMQEQQQQAAARVQSRVTESDVSFMGPDGQPWLYSAASAAADSNKSLLEIRVPGVLTAEELKDQLNLDEVRVTIDRQGIYYTEDLQSWRSGSVMDAGSLKGMVAEFAACLGPDGVQQVIVDLSR